MGIHIGYRLPHTVKAIGAAWTATCQSSAVVTALLAAIQVQLLTFFKDPRAPDVQCTAIMLATYAGLFLSVSATISSLIITDEVGELPMRAARQSQPEDKGIIFECTRELLQRYGARPSFFWVQLHWLLSLGLSIMCLIIQVLIYIWVHEKVVTKVVTLCIALFGLLPLLHFFPGPRLSRECDDAEKHSSSASSSSLTLPP
ncbi:hypothetical protein FA95DRAFT_1605210 [Auriscalpium vulgare]|uniref:Uncharacterized protein n=1 Tax=Auriscalpium vulgare TaxID=40419 RepID=A0ACB8RXC0_9AGAM|nr:hypothetical protein FA95DRAFT_1605210 [Auriscalpium vulgare]